MPIGYTENNSNNTDYRSNDEKDDNVGVGWGGGGKKKKKTEREKKKETERDDDFKIRAKTRQQQQQQMTMMMKNMVQIHDEQRSIQITISHRNTHKNTAQKITVIINNENKNSKCRPKSDTQ